MPEAPYGRSNRWLTVILVTPEEFGANRETVRLALEAEDIESRPVWKPMHLQPVFKGCKRIGGKVAEDLFNRGLCLPSGTAMTDDRRRSQSSYGSGQELPQAIIRSITPDTFLPISAQSTFG